MEKQEWQINKIAIKWYRELGFPKDCDEEFYALAEEVDSSQIDLENPVAYLLKVGNQGLNLLYFLSRCEEMHVAFERRGIPECYFRAAADGIVKEALSCRKLWGKLGIYEVGWMNAVVRGDQIFRIGRLNFTLDIGGEWCAGGDIQVGDKIVSVHIPGGEKLNDLDCYQSIAEAERFVMKYFPEHDFKCFICGSWLLYEGYEAFLGEESNITKFRKLFTPYLTKESDSAIKFGLGKNVTRENLSKFVPCNEFQRKLKEYIQNGGKLYETFGTRPRAHEDIRGIDCHYHQMQWFSDDMSQYPTDFIPECEDTGSMIQAAGDYMESCNLQGINVLCMPNMEDLFGARDITQNILGAIIKCENNRVYAHGALVYPEFPAKGDYDFCGQAKRLIDMGFDGIKLIETKPNAHKKVGLPVCDAAYEPFWTYLEKEQIHVLCHVNDPVYCWDPGRLAPGICFTDRFAHYETIYSEVLRVLEKHPDLKITFAHFLFLGYDTERLSSILDRYKNVCIDITPAEEEYGFLSKDPKRAREFFVRYADRILLGTDSKNAFRRKFKEEQMARINRFLKTNDSFRGLGNHIQGIALERPQLENILYRNFQRRVGETPKEMDRQALKHYLEEMLPALPAGKTMDMIKSYLIEKL